MSDPVSRETRKWSEISSESISGANQCPVVFILQATYCPLPWGGERPRTLLCGAACDSCRDAVSRETRRGRTISVVFGERCQFCPRVSDRFTTMRRTNRSGRAPRSWRRAWRCTSYIRRWLLSIRVEPLFHVKPGATGAQVDFARERRTAPPKSPLPWPQLGVATSQSFLE